jgi:glycosyltransferase involved in cell wall biosynthesis
MLNSGIFHEGFCYLQRESISISSLPRVLYVTLSVPFPSTSGGRKRDGELIRRLSRVAEIHLVVITSSFDRDSKAAELALQYCHSVTVGKPEAPPSGSPDGVRTIHSSAVIESLSVRHTDFPFDLMHIEGYYLASVARAFPDIPLVLVAENIESDVDRQLATLGLSRYDSELTLQYERDAWRRAKTLCVLTPEDSARVQALAPDVSVVTCPNGLDPFNPVFRLPESWSLTPTVGFLGNYSYAPSEDAALFLIAEVWPLLHQMVPNVRLLIAGAGAGSRVAELTKATPDATFLGAISDLSLFFTQLTIFVAPVRAGGGIKVKILDAISHAIPVVTTPIGGQGFGIPPLGLRVVSDTGSIAREAGVLLSSSAALLSASSSLGELAALLPSWEDASTAVWTQWKLALSDW